MVELREVTKDNYLDCLRLRLLPEQEGFLAPNGDTIAQSKFESHHRVRAIYNNNKVVGLLSYCHEDEPEDLELYWLFRFMVDKSCQGQGIGSNALKQLLEEVKALGGKQLRTMHKPSNLEASKVYKNFGFTEIGELDDGDTLLEINIT
ncbi:GNAT family N-acetyltransferase [Endozoicomonas arenosclerae]|uniref:GNAT family N-acetyltransferase n=1 Tax=Endozoicomonas arenosclerae TaxID=1633495 RepID=UPI0007856BFE|nr:GNAT family N-acetyltransferase [Endozoicomonas arenosclerae]